MALANKSLLVASGLAVALGSHANAAVTSITLTTDALGLGSTDINYAKNGSAVEDDRPGKLVTSSVQNIGSVLTIQTDNLAGPGTLTEPLLATVTARTYMDVTNNLPGGADIYAGVITLTADSGALEDDGLGLRAFGIDTTNGSPNFGKRYQNPAYVSAGNPNGYQMEGSKEVSGGVDTTDFNDWVGGQPGIPNNEPPHVDEDVTFDINDAELEVDVDSVSVLLTNIKAGSDNLFDLAVDLTVNLVGGGTFFSTYERVGDFPGIFSQFGSDDIIEIDFSGLGLTGNVDNFTIGARDDPADAPKETDEHFLINGFTVDAVPVPEPASAALVAAGLGLALGRRRQG